MQKVVHFEIPVKDMAKAKKFYGGIFNWQLNELPEANYTLVNTVAVDENQMPKESGAINGGLTMQSDDIKSTVVVIDVPNVDEYVKKVESAGGKLVKPKVKVFEMGYVAYVKDPDGNVIGIWETI